MSEQHESSEEQRYLIHIIWVVNEDGHGHGHALHNIHEGVFQGEWDPKALLEDYVSKYQPSWMPDGNGRIGQLNEKVSAHSINVYRVSEKDDKVWNEWSEEAIAKRDTVTRDRSYEADLMTIKMLMKKHNLTQQDLESAE